MQKDISRRAFIRAAGVAAAVLPLRQVPVSASKTASRPNILIIHVDEHRIDCLGAYGNKQIRTPHIDALAADGVRYNNSFCPFPVCTPSRYSLLSGLYVNEHRGWSNRCTLAPDIPTFPRILRSAGYRTKAVGKMHFAPTYLDVGFDELELAEQDGPGRWDDDYHRYLMQRGLVDRNDAEDQLANEYRKHASKKYWNTFGALVSNLPEEHHSTTWVADRAIQTLSTWNANEPSLMMIGFVKPHHPFDPPAPWDKMYDPEDMSILPGWTDSCLPRDSKFSRGYFPNSELTEDALKRATAYYYATISQIDHHVGRMVELLKRKGIYDNTMIVFTADHGDYMGFHHMLLKGNYMYDPVVKVPLIVKWPGGGRAASVSNQMVNNIDLAPTICKAAGCKVPKTMHGQRLQEAGTGYELIFAEANGGRQVMARSRTRKLILAPPGQENLFFDIEADPQEIDNLYDSPKYRDEIQQMQTALEAWRCKEANPKPFLDLNAPVIDQPNVPPRDLSHRAAIISYYRKKIMALQGRS